MNIAVSIVIFLSCARGSWSHSGPPSIKLTALEDYPDGLDSKQFTNLNSRQYFFGQTPVSWFKAHLICRSMHANLASFETRQELAAISDYLKLNYGRDRYWWLSGSDLESEGDFYWYRNGERFTYSDWAKGQPNNYQNEQHCVFISFESATGRYQMSDHNCSSELYYVCQTEKKQNIVLNLTWD